MRWRHRQCTLGIAACALFSGASAQNSGYVGMGPPPPSLSVGEITVRNPTPQEMVFGMSGAGCRMTEVRIPPTERVKLGCAGSESVTTMFRTIKPNGAVLAREQKLATRLHYVVVLDDAGAFILSSGPQGAR